MSHNTVYYEYHDGNQVPKLFIINFTNDSSFSWEDEYYYVQVNAPFEKQDLYDFDEFVASATLNMEDITIRTNNPGHFGIHLPNVKRRIEDMGGDIYDIQQFVMLVADIEEILHTS